MSVPTHCDHWFACRSVQQYVVTTTSLGALSDNKMRHDDGAVECGRERLAPWFGFGQFERRVDKELELDKASFASSGNIKGIPNNMPRKVGHSVNLSKNPCLVTHIVPWQSCSWGLAKKTTSSMNVWSQSQWHAKVRCSHPSAHRVSHASASLSWWQLDDPKQCLEATRMTKPSEPTVSVDWHCIHNFAALAICPVFTYHCPIHRKRLCGWHLQIIAHSGECASTWVEPFIMLCHRLLFSIPGLHAELVFSWAWTTLQVAWYPQCETILTKYESGLGTVVSLLFTATVLFSSEGNA